MAYSTSTVIVGTEWTAVTTAIALLQFNDEMQMIINAGSMPAASDAGFKMLADEKYINATAGISVWARAIPGQGTGRESIRLAEDV